MAYLNNVRYFFLLICVVSSSPALANVDTPLEWRVESELPKLETVPAYAGEPTPFLVKEKPQFLKKRVVRIEKPKELTETQVKVLRAADVLNEIRSVLKKEEVFNADISDLKISAVIETEGVKSALIKNQWYEENDILEVPVAAKESLVLLVESLKNLDPSLAKIVETQVKEKIQMVKNLNLTVNKIDDSKVMFIDEQGKQHVISFKIKNF